MKTYQKALSALADPTREAILERLRTGPCAVGKLAAALPVSRPAVSQHLRVLREARLVREQRDGTRRIYRLDPHGAQALREQLDRWWGGILDAFSEAAEEQSPGGGGS